MTSGNQEENKGGVGVFGGGGGFFFLVVGGLFFFFFWGGFFFFFFFFFLVLGASAAKSGPSGEAYGQLPRIREVFLFPARSLGFFFFFFPLLGPPVKARSKARFTRLKTARTFPLSRVVFS